MSRRMIVMICGVLAAFLSRATPEFCRYPYISTYYVEPTVKAGDEVTIGYYVTDWDQSELRFADDSWRFDIMVELIAERTAAEIVRPKLPTTEFKPPAPVKKVASKQKKLQKGQKEKSAKTKSGKAKPVKTRTAKAKIAKTSKAVKRSAVLGKDGGPLVVTGVPAGDGEVSLGRLPVGDYAVGIWCRDGKGRESHRVWHLFRVREAADLTIPEKAVHVLTEADLAGYGISNDDHRERLAPNGKTTATTDPTQPGYTVEFKANEKGVCLPYAYKTRVVTYDTGYDKEAVEAEALDNVKGLNRLLDDLAALGYRKLVLLPGTYRLSASSFITMPDSFTLDMNGATFKENGFTGDHACIVKFESTYDAHLVNGIVEGDYYEHDYEHSPHASEWPMGVEIVGESLYSSVEDVIVRDVTGYGGGNGVGHDRRGGSAHWMRHVNWGEMGILNRQTGKVDAKVAGFVTSDPVELPPDATFLQLSKFLGYQGFFTKGWWMTVCFYSSGNKLLSAETGFQYRVMRVPKGTARVRVSIEADSVESVPRGEGSELVASRMRTPQNCSIVRCQFIHDRCVGYAASAMKNFLFRGNVFDNCGDAQAKCSFDAEDGWDLMQDVYLDGNIFRFNHAQNDLIGCGGHNFIMEHNVGRIYFWERCYSPVARQNSGLNGVFRCASRRRSGYGRFSTDNRWPYGLEFGVGDEPYIDWDYAMRGLAFAPDKRHSTPIIVGKKGRLSDSTFDDVEVKNVHLSACRLRHCNGVLPQQGDWTDCRIANGDFKGSGEDMVFSGCTISQSTFRNIGSGKVTFRNCSFDRSSFRDCKEENVVFETCTFNQTIFNQTNLVAPSGRKL